MRYTGYGTFFGGILAIGVLIKYALLHNTNDTYITPFIFIAMLIYFFLVGFYVGDKTCSVKEGLKAGLIAGAITMSWLAVAYFFVHNVFFYYDTISDPEKLAGFKASGLLSMRRYLIYSNIRFGIIGLTLGTLFAGFSAGAGSFTVKHTKAADRCNTIIRGEVKE